MCVDKETKPIGNCGLYRAGWVGWVWSNEIHQRRGSNFEGGVVDLRGSILGDSKKAERRLVQISEWPSSLSITPS
jgi:hypothetical protein